MKKYFLMCLIVFFLLFFASGSETTNAGFDENTYGIVAEIADIDNFSQPTEPTAIVLLATGIFGLFSISRSKLKK